MHLIARPTRLAAAIALCAIAFAACSKQDDPPTAQADPGPNPAQETAEQTAPQPQEDPAMPDPGLEPFLQTPGPTDAYATTVPPDPAQPTAQEPAQPTATDPVVGTVSPGVTDPREQVRAWVFGYHQFQTPKPNPYSITVEKFRFQLDYLRANGWEVVPMQQLLAFLKGGPPLPPKTAVITVDDGFASVYKHAYPLLKEFGYPWTFFCYTDFVATGRSAVTWAQLQEMEKNGCDVQSHTRSHPFLTRKSGKSPEAYDEWLDKELRGSKETIEKHLGKKVNALAYSYGAWNDRVRDKALAVGYEALFTVKGEMTTAQTPPTEIGRVIISRDNEEKFSSYLAMLPKPPAPQPAPGLAPAPSPAPSMPAAPQPAPAMPAMPHTPPEEESRL